MSYFIALVQHNFMYNFKNTALYILSQQYGPSAIEKQINVI